MLENVALVTEIASNPLPVSGAGAWMRTLLVGGSRPPRAVPITLAVGEGAGEVRGNRLAPLERRPVIRAAIIRKTRDVAQWKGMAANRSGRRATRWQMLESYAGKLARTVLKGPGRS